MKYMILIILFSINLFAGEAENKFSQANEFYNNSEYEQAITLYRDIINNGYHDSKVFYNLANAYYKLDMLPQAILNYERALKANPDNEDAEFNLRLANLKIIDKIEAVPKVFYVQWYDNLLNSYSSTGLGIFSTVFIWIAFVLMILFIKLENPFFKKISFALSILSIAVFLIVGIMAYNDYDNERNKNEGVIFSTSVYVKSSPDDAGTNLFMLHEGTKVEVLDQVNQWQKIKIENGNIGWIAPGSIEII